MNQKKIMICLSAVLILCISLVNASTFETKIELELTGLTGISQIDNSDGTSVQITIHNSTGIVAASNASAGVYASGMVIPMTGSKFYLSYATDYTYNLSTQYGDFLYNFTTPDEPATGGAELHTGQTTPYRAGDDANVDGISKSYTSDGCGIGTVLDNHTGLCWQYDDYNGAKFWVDAIDYCNSLDLGGHTDWHLPTAVEGITIFDYSCYSATPNHCFSNFQNIAFDWVTATSDYWTGTTRPDDSRYAYRLRMDSGYLTYNGKGGNHYVRCVRSE